MSALRRPGSRWRLLVHEWDKKRKVRVTEHTVQSDAMVAATTAALRRTPGLYEDIEQHRADEVAAGRASETVLADTEFDELVVSEWLHIEQMDARVWWLNVGGVTLTVQVDRDGRPESVHVYGPSDYDSPRANCEYECTWSAP